jgi:uncharacterized BrkB/YihY/UPF0761 family membrane protein
MDLLLYGFPILVFIILSITLYTLSSEEDKDATKYILPSAIVALLVFLIIKFKDSMVLNSEPMKSGNYLDHTNVEM